MGVMCNMFILQGKIVVVKSLMNDKLKEAFVRYCHNWKILCGMLWLPLGLCLLVCCVRRMC